MTIINCISISHFGFQEKNNNQNVDSKLYFIFFIKDYSEEETFGSSFSEIAIRHAFIRKVIIVR
jgi:hypothetical protein